METKQLTEQEILFCELYAHGEAPFGGNVVRCYQEVFGGKGRNTKHKALKLVSRPEVQEYLQKLDAYSFEEARYTKVFLRENLMSIIQECATATYRDRKGTLLSPASLRSVAVSAAKALMDIYPVKEAQKSKLSIEGAGEGGITFNVIMPESCKPETKE